MAVFDTLGSIANQIKNVTLPGLVAATAFAVLVWPPAPVDQLTIPTVNGVQIHVTPSWPLELATKPGDPLYEFVVKGEPACSIPRERTTLATGKTVLEIRQAAIDNQKTLDDTHQLFEQCINQEAVLSAADATLLANTNDLIKQRTAERATILSKFQTYGLELSPVTGNFQQLLDAKDREIDQLQVEALAFTQVQQERVTRVVNLKRQEKEVTDLLAEPGRLRPKQKFDDILAGLSNHVTGFIALVIAWGLLLTPLNRAAFSFLYSDIFDGMWDMLRPGRVPSPQLQAIRTMNKPFQPGPNFALLKLSFTAVVVAVILVWSVLSQKQDAGAGPQTRLGIVHAATRDPLTAAPSAQDHPKQSPPHNGNSDSRKSGDDKPLDPLQPIPSAKPVPDCWYGNCPPGMLSGCPAGMNCGVPDYKRNPRTPDGRAYPSPAPKEWVPPPAPPKPIPLPQPACGSAKQPPCPSARSITVPAVEIKSELGVFVRSAGIALCELFIAMYLPKVKADWRSLTLLRQLRSHTWERQRRQAADPVAHAAAKDKADENTTPTPTEDDQSDSSRVRGRQGQSSAQSVGTGASLLSLLSYRNPSKADRLMELSKVSQAHDEEEQGWVNLTGAKVSKTGKTAAPQVPSAAETSAPAGGATESDGATPPDPVEAVRSTCLARLNLQWAKLSQPEYAIGMKTIAQSDYDALTSSFESDSQLCAGLLLPVFLLVWAVLYVQVFALPEWFMLVLLLVATFAIVVSAVDLRHKYQTSVDMLIAGSFLGICMQKEENSTTPADAQKATEKLIAAALKKAKIYRETKTDLTIVPDKGDGKNDE